MRLRMLGEGQSVIFCVPEEIQKKIRPDKSKETLPADQEISVVNILTWAIGETWRDIHRSMGLWACQGRRNEHHREIWKQARSTRETEPGQTQQIHFGRSLAEKYLEDEAQTLDRRYRPRMKQSLKESEQSTDTDPISLRCAEFKNLDLGSAALQEEEERELSPEIEQERQDERPPEATPALHKVHHDIKEFVQLGAVLDSSKGYGPAFLALRKTKAGEFCDVSQFRSRLLASEDFASTIEPRGSSDALDSYQRSVQWILTSGPPAGDDDTKPGTIEHMMVISPFEARELLPAIQQSDVVALHLYAPRSNLSYRPLDTLDLYTVPERLKTRRIPRRLATELNLFAGQLYFDSFERYVDACRFLGISYETPKEGEEIAADGFILRDGEGRVGGESGLRSSPVAFFKALHMGIRRNCESIDKTHMGKLLDNQLLQPSDFEG